jgi:hypothetical protein
MHIPTNKFGFADKNLKPVYMAPIYLFIYVHVGIGILFVMH